MWEATKARDEGSISLLANGGPSRERLLQRVELVDRSKHVSPGALVCSRATGNTARASWYKRSPGSGDRVFLGP